MLASWIAGEAKDDGLALKVFVDTAPVMEKPLAEAAGIGWQGKHTNVVSRDFGSWLFLGSIFLTLDLPADASVGMLLDCHLEFDTGGRIRVLKKNDVLRVSE